MFRVLGSFSQCMIPVASLAFGVLSCGGETPTPFDSKEVAQVHRLPFFRSKVEIIYTKHGVPHVYAKDRNDMLRGAGFVMAKERFFQMDLLRRYSLGTLSEVFGPLVLSTDVEHRSIGTLLAVEANVRMADPEVLAEAQAYAEGINAYIEEVQLGQLPAPSEYRTAAPFLNAGSAEELMKVFSAKDVMAIVTTLIYESGYSGSDLGRGTAFLSLENRLKGTPKSGLRRAGALQDMWRQVKQPQDVAAVPGFGLWVNGSRVEEKNGGVSKNQKPLPRQESQSRLPAVEGLEAFVQVQQRIEERFLHAAHGWGSNEWAVMGSKTKDGASMIAGDGHLSLTAPPLFFQMGYSTEGLGDGTTHVFGNALPGAPVMGAGTNGSLAWTMTNFSSDVTDWYQDEMVLDAQGALVGTRFSGEVKQMAAVEEIYDVRIVPVLGEGGGPTNITRHQTWDGRMLLGVEGRRLLENEMPGAGESKINIAGIWIAPKDMNNDGVVTGVTMDTVLLQGGRTSEVFRSWERMKDVEAFRTSMKQIAGLGGAFVAADEQGDVMHSGYHIFPCRAYLERNKDGSFAAGAHPQLLLDGTKYRGFQIEFNADGSANDSAGERDPYACVVPFAAWPQAINSRSGYLVHTNSDPANITSDNNMHNEPWYISGPWNASHRAYRIGKRLEDNILAGTLDEAAMQAIQGDHVSSTATDLIPHYLEVLERVSAWTGKRSSETEERLRQLYRGEQTFFEEVRTRFKAWQDRGFQAESGVETFYHRPSLDEKKDAVATMMFNSSMRFLKAAVLDDEPVPSVYWTGRPATAVMAYLLGGRGKGNPNALASFDEDTSESVFLDDLRTKGVTETGDEVLLLSLKEMKQFLSSNPVLENGMPPEAGNAALAVFGGFGHGRIDEWLWGLRHRVRFESLMGSAAGSSAEDPALKQLLAPYQFGTRQLPLAENILPTDPRSLLPWFPRWGDTEGVDACNPGLSGYKFDCGAGPVFRMVVAVRPHQKTTIHNQLPGGQSGRPESEHFYDQLPGWLSHESEEQHIYLKDVLAHAESREVILPR